MDYHVVAYTNYELVGLPLHKLWASFSISQAIRIISCLFLMVWEMGKGSCEANVTLDLYI